jgi:hypothetical protein
MGIGPAYAIPAALKAAGVTIGDIDVFEVNEAFASQAKYCVDVLGIPAAKLNPKVRRTNPHHDSVAHACQGCWEAVVLPAWAAVKLLWPAVNPASA